jgi:hexosaminidase
MIPAPDSWVVHDGVRPYAAPSTGIDSSMPAEGYRLSVGESGISIIGGSEAGVFYGLQTLRQLMPPSSLRRAGFPFAGDLGYQEISDAPRFGWRGVMLDVARHFMPVGDVLRFVDLIAFHKLNVLHLHLTDDQGWRVAVPGRPRLTEVGAWRARSMLGARQHGRYDERPHGGFYSADDLREIVAHAAAQFVTVVPEIDMPGHMQAAIAAYPELGNGRTVSVREAWGISTHLLNVSDVALDFCREVLDEICAIFPGPIIGIGGDECPPDEWRASAAVQARMATLGLGSTRELHGWFVAQMAAHLRTHGRRLYGWDEILDGGAPAGAVVAAWRGAGRVGAAARAGHDVVACPDTSVYLDYRQSDHPGEPTPVGTLLALPDIYGFDPVAGLSAGEAERVLGGQANIWTEHMESARRVDYMAFPRLCAFAEAMWSATRDYPSFATRLEPHLDRLDALGVNYRPLAGPRSWDGRPDAPGNPLTLAERLATIEEMISSGP